MDFALNPPTLDYVIDKIGGQVVKGLYFAARPLSFNRVTVTRVPMAALLLLTPTK